MEASIDSKYEFLRVSGSTAIQRLVQTWELSFHQHEVVVGGLLRSSNVPS